jgi:hypothetical protein
MVDSIHHADRIGVISPPGQLRRVGHRKQPRKDSREDGGADSQSTEKESRPDDPDIDQGRADDRSEITAPPDSQNNRRTGRRIDVRI